MNQKISVIGGDMRQVFAAKHLMTQGHSVKIYGFDSTYLSTLCESVSLREALREADCVLLPLPVTRDGETLSTPLWEKQISLAELFSLIPDETTLFCGMAEKLPACFQKRVKDYAKDEGFLLQNAYLTAEGALELAISKTDISLRGASVLVTGYGRIGCLLSEMFQRLGAVTYVASRNPSHLVKIELTGCIGVSYEMLPHILPEMDMIFNTVPFMIFKEELLGKIRQHCLFVDLASLPGGVDKQAAKACGVEVIHALSLPGKVAPVSSGKIVADTLLRLLSKKFGNEE